MESEVGNLKPLINEQDPTKDLSKFQYFMNAKDTDMTQPSQAKQLYFTQNGNTYDVYAKRPGKELIEFTGHKLPLENQLAVVWNESEGTFKPNDEIKKGMMFAKWISPDWGMDVEQGNWVVYNNVDNIPTFAKFMRTPSYPIDVLENDLRKTRLRLKDGQSFTVNDYFVRNKDSKMGNTFSIENITIATPTI